MASPLDVCIRGAGIAGRSLALLLARERLRVGLVAGDAPVPGAVDVRAYALNNRARELLQSLRAWPGEEEATPVTCMQVHGDDGGEVTFSAREEHTDALTWIADVGALERNLDEALRFQPLVERLDQPRDAALTVVCEGKASTTRAEYGVQFQSALYPQRAIAARLTCEKRHEQVARQWFQDGDILALLPMGGPQGNLVALVWSVQEPRADGLMGLPAAEFEEKLAEACGHALGKMTLASDRAAWPLMLARADRWCGPGWALCGDAAHVVHPLAGQGLNLGLGDVQELVQVLHGREYWRSVGDVKLLRRYERARKAEVAAMAFATDGIQQLFAQPAPAASWLRNWGMRGFEALGPVKHWAAKQAMSGLR